MLVKVLDNIACYDMFLDLAANVCKGNGLQLLALYFSPVLNIAVTLTVFQSLGTVPVLKLFWNILARSGEISAASFFMNLAGSISGPIALLGFSFCSNLRTPSAVTLMSGIVGNGVPSVVGMLLQSSLVHVD